MLSRWTPPTRRRPWDPVHAASLTWEKMARIREFAGLPFILKGVATGEDALLAVEHGVDVIWVSNHGGRQLDHGLGAMDMLGGIVEAVDGRARIVLDGGIQRGSDVAKAVALGADAVAIGRLQAWGLAAAGREGVVRVLEILEDELAIAMALLGVTSVDQLTPAYLCRAEAVTAAHEMSAWVNKTRGPDTVAPGGHAWNISPGYRDTWPGRPFRPTPSPRSRRIGREAAALLEWVSPSSGRGNDYGQGCHHFRGHHRTGYMAQQRRRGDVG